MKQFLTLIVLTCAIWQNGSAWQAALNRQAPDSSFSRVAVKKRKAGKICDTCSVNFALSAESDFSYIITGAGHTPHRFYPLLDRIKAAYKGKAAAASIHLISQSTIGITFLPNFLMEKNKRLQLYRNFGGENYHNLEFQATRNNSVIKQWAPLSSLGEDQDYAILGSKQVSDQLLTMPWKQSFYAGNFKLDINDSLNITIRDIKTLKIVKTITVIRPEDPVTNFIYYQIPLTDEQLSANLQHVLNLRSVIPVVYRGDTSSIFEKNYGTIGILRFQGLTDHEELQYSFGKSPYQWKHIQAIDPQNGVFIVLGNDMPEGKDQDIYLRYSSQPETIHKITIKVKEHPFQMPWFKIAVISIFLLTASGIAFYLWDKRQQRKVTSLKRKNEDIETRLSLLSGQLNPHFLFNSLNAIQGTINSNNPDKANAFIGNVAGFMRDVMDNGKKEFVSLQEELKLEADYLKLEQERSRFNYVITIAPELDTSQIDFPPLLLQPVLENSIRHAFNRELHHPMINIKILSGDNTLYLEVSDNGNLNWDSVGMHEGYGLSLTRKRIAVYNEKLESMCIQMQINYQPGIGTITTFTFQNWLA